MTDLDKENKIRNRKIAENESQRQVVSNIRVSTWAIVVAVVFAVASVGWVLVHN